MAITNARMQIKRGNEVDFDAEKMLVGEWALSTDKRIVRICVAPNVCIRMATYDAFEVDMAQIDKILEECRTIEDVVKLINSQVSEKLELTIEYTNQAKQYRDETEQFRNEVESMVDVGIATTERAGIVKPDGITIRVDEDGTIHADNGTVDYNELENKPSINGMELSGDKSLDEFGIASVEALEETNYKVDTILEKAGLTLKNTASGSPIHLTDSANGKNVGFGLYGKAEQKQYSGKNLLKNTATSQTVNGVTFTVNNEDGSVTANGTASAVATFETSKIQLPIGRYILSGCPSGGNSSSYEINFYDATQPKYYRDYGSGITFDVTETELNKIDIRVFVVIRGGQTVNNLTFYPMIRLASITDSTYEPFTNGASPNPDYPQEITVAGASGSVEVVSCGKNLINPTLETGIHSGINHTRNIDGTYLFSGTCTSTVWLHLASNVSLKKGTYIMNGVPVSDSNFTMYIEKDGSRVATDNGNGIEFTLSEDIDNLLVVVRVQSGYVANNILLSPMIRLASDTNDIYEPYKETTSTIPTPDGLAGIKVSSGGNYTDENGQQWIADEIVKYADGSGKRIQRIAKRVYDGSESWLKYNYIYYRNVSNLKTETDVICSHFKSAKISATDNTKYDFNIDSAQGSLRIMYSEMATVDDFKAWLSENNITVYYPLAEPIITDLSAEEIAEIEKLYTFYPVTNISNDADCGMSITYMADAKNYIDNRLALIESAMLNNI